MPISTPATRAKAQTEFQGLADDKDATAGDCASAQRRMATFLKNGGWRTTAHVPAPPMPHQHATRKSGGTDTMNDDAQLRNRSPSSARRRRLHVRLHA